MKDFFEELGAILFLAVGIILAVLVILCAIGLFIQGDHTEITPAGDGCYTVTKTHTNWYPSEDKILSRDLICEGK